MVVEPLHRAKIERRARRLEYATTIWNSTEAVVTITTGVAAHSLGLVAFGLDSCVEVFASLVVLWQMRRSGDTARSARALRLIAGSFGVLAVYLGFESVHGVIVRHAAQQTILGLGMLAITVAVMFTLAWGKRRAGLDLDNRALLANASMTFIDGCLAASILVAVGAAVWLGWWWADPLAAGVVAVVAAREAVDGWRDARA
jgi:divalent metal cation (Fe/Co/Zn/Cd) transporter